MMKFRSILALAAITILVAACRLKPIEEAAAITQIPTFTQAPSNTPAPTFTPQPTFTTQPTQQTVATAVIPNCVPTHSEWPVYTVQAGDTLGSIASRTGSDSTTLATVNCLANANLISVGMNLRVPRLPATPTPTPTAASGIRTVGGQGTVPSTGCYLVNGNRSETIYLYNHANAGEAAIAIMAGGSYLPFVGPSNFGILVVNVPEMGQNAEIAPNPHLSIQGADCNRPRPAEQCLLTENGAGMPVISPSSVRSATCVGLQAGTVTVTWPEAPRNATMVEFWRMNATGMTDVIGTDSNLSDGASIQWQVYEGMPASVIYAVPYVQGGASWSGQLSVYIGQ